MEGFGAISPLFPLNVPCLDKPETCVPPLWPAQSKLEKGAVGSHLKIHEKLWKVVPVATRRLVAGGPGQTVRGCQREGALRP